MTDHEDNMPEMNKKQINKFTVVQMDLLDDIKGKGTSIAILDMIGTKGNKGFHTSHKAFCGNITSEDITCYVINGIQDSTNHATNCAGIAVGKPFTGYYKRNNENVPMNYEGGVAHEAKAKIFLIDHNDGVLQALSKIDEEEIDVVLMSLGWHPRDLVNDLITQELIELSKSKLVVVSTGNYSPVEGVMSHADLNEVTSAGCLD